jgi:AraC-like DNA-binding protein
MDAVREQARKLAPRDVTPGVGDIVHARVLREFPALVTALGGDDRALLFQAGVEPAAAVTYSQMIRLFARAALVLECADFGMRLAVRQGGGIFGPLGLVMKNSRHFGDALDYAVKHTFAHSPAAQIWLRRYPDDEMVFCGHDILLDDAGDKAQAMELLLLAGHLAAMEMTGGQVRARKVHFRHRGVSPRGVYRRYFGCEVLFGQSEDGMYFLEQDLACPIEGADAQARQLAASFIETEFARHRPPLQALVRSLVLQHLGTEGCTNDAVAASLNLHPRTLRRRLVVEGTSFQKIKDEVRRDFMLHYIQKTDLDFCGISARLGFAEQSVMSRYCHRWFAVSPSRLRAFVQVG